MVLFAQGPLRDKGNKIYELKMNMFYKNLKSVDPLFKACIQFGVFILTIISSSIRLNSSGFSIIGK